MGKRVLDNLIKKIKELALNLRPQDAADNQISHRSAPPASDSSPSDH